MLVREFQTQEEWQQFRNTRITGSKVGGLISKRGGGYKKGFYELLAERLAIPEEQENPMDRGNRLEDVALQRFAKETGKKVSNDLIVWIREDNEHICISPDGVIEGTRNTEAAEVKCLNSASHLEAWVKKIIPSEYYDQAVQYFVVNDKLKVLYFIFYDPRIPKKDFFYLTITRKYVEADVKKYLEEEREMLEELDRLAEEISY